MTTVPSIPSNCGVPVPGLIYGTAWKQERTQVLVEQALALGFRGIDTACQPKHYHEPGVGAGLATWISNGGKREEIYLQTKFTPVDGQDPLRLPYDPATSLSEQVSESFEVSLRNLQTDYLDSLVLHSPPESRSELMEIWSAMETVAASGAVRQLGISNCYDLAELEYLYDHAAVKPAVVQNRFYTATGYDREIRAFCRDGGMIYQSFWTLTANGWLLRQLQDMAAAYDRSPAQVLFRYLSQCGIVPLTGTTSAIHMRQDLAIFEFELTESEVAEIDGLLKA
ncbi:MAG: aldo/keto reductase [Methylococcaceae bacterium]|nr:aldo/keto reductase [Methylococcaceae bacterium]